MTGQVVLEERLAAKILVVRRLQPLCQQRLSCKGIAACVTAETDPDQAVQRYLAEP